MSLETTTQLKDSLFAKRVLYTIKSETELDESTREVFNRILKYINAIKNGKKQISTGTLMGNPVKAISAYRKAIGIISIIECDEEKNEEYFNNLLSNIETEVNGVLYNNMSISPKNLEKTMEFFEGARAYAIDMITQRRMKDQEIENWKIQTPMQL